MSWAARRRLLIMVLIAAAILLGLGVFAFASLYRPPSCQDNVQNQDEEGVDCGGPCALVCTAQAVPPSTLFTTLIKTKTGRVDLAASVQNRNSFAAARAVPYTVTLYDTNGKSRTRSGVIDLPPHTSVPVFIPGVAMSDEFITRAFLAIDQDKLAWYRVENDPRVVPTVQTKPVSGTHDAPRVQAVLLNGSLSTLSRIPVVAFVREASTTNIIAASQTVVPSIGPQSSAIANFTWNEPFASDSVRVEVIPLVPLP